jgi:hypothetical protein
VLEGSRPALNAHEIFVRYFLPLYPADAREDLARARSTDANPGQNPAILAHLDEAAQRFASNAPALFGLFGKDLAVDVLDRSDASIHRLSAALTRTRRDAWAGEGEAGTPGNTLFNVVVHGAAYLGACVVASHGGTWRVRRPLWESVVGLKSHAGDGDLAVFHWWLKALGDDALAAPEPGAPAGATLADRYRAHVEVPCARADDLPRVFAGDRSLPRLKEPNYDRLHKYLRAHLPELRDLGEHFPTPERFSGFAFRWMDFHRVGDGRLALMAGASPAGLHLFWLDGAGFDKSVFYPCDAFPDPIVRVDGEHVVAITSEAGSPRVHEMLWWGP